MKRPIESNSPLALLSVFLVAGAFLCLGLYHTARHSLVPLREETLRNEKTLVQHEAFSKPLTAPAPPQTFSAAAIAQHLHTGNDKVLVGPKGWLFYRLGLAHVIGPGFLTPQFMAPRARKGADPDPRVAMRDWHAQLQKRGITLVLLPIPDKATLYPEQIMPAYRGPLPHNVSFAAWKREMEGDGIRVFDPTAVLMAAKHHSADWLYLPDDSHWTPYAAQVCAQGLAQWLNRTIALPKVTPIAYHPVLAQVAPPHDLTSMIQLAPTQRASSVTSIPLRHIYKPQGQYLPKAQNADVLIIGDSYAGQYASMQAGLAAQLSYELKRPVDCLAVPNGGSWAARFRLRDAMLHGANPLQGKKLVIWEFTTRDLSSGVWKACTLPTENMLQSHEKARS